MRNDATKRVLDLVNRKTRSKQAAADPAPVEAEKPKKRKRKASQ